MGFLCWDRFFDACQANNDLGWIYSQREENIIVSWYLDTLLTESRLIATQSQQPGLVNACTLLTEVVNICTVVNKCAVAGGWGLLARNALATCKGKHCLKKIVHSRSYGATANILCTIRCQFMLVSLWLPLRSLGVRFVYDLVVLWSCSPKVHIVPYG